MHSRLVRVALLLGSISFITPNNPIRTVTAFSVIGYIITISIIPKLGPSFIRIGLKGKDLSKPPPVSEIPETMGLVIALTYMFLMFGLIPFIFFKYLVSFGSMSDNAIVASNYIEQYQAITNNRLFPHNKLAEFLSAILCLQSTMILGLLDDLFDIKWRHKFFIPAVASLPLLIVYYVDFSVTSVVIPKFIFDFPGGYHLVNLLNYIIKYGNHLVTLISGLSFRTLQTDYVIPDSTPKLLDLGIFYYVYMSAVTIFAPNSINMLAGINGLEVGQSLVLAVILLINDICYLSSNISQAAHDSHLLSVIFIVPFIGVSLALLQYNWFPAKVFVGDTYCYFSGMIFASVGILGHFSKTLLIFLLPQILNFIYSLPQLFNIVPCPRHRLPKFNQETGLMNPSYGELKNKRKISITLLILLEKCKLVSLQRDKQNNIVKFSNLTIINLLLVWLGPLREDYLCIIILLIQFVIGILMLIVRHTVGPWLFGYDNLSWGVK